MDRARIVLHLPRAVARGDVPLKHFYRRLVDGFAERGIEAAIVPHDRARILDEVAGDEDFHIVDHGGARHPRILNAGVAYIFPYWNLDPWGIRANSSIAGMAFDPGSIDAEAAAAHRDRLRAKWLLPRRSRVGQKEEFTTVPADCIAVFLQDEGHRMVGETAFLGTEAMIAALIRRDDPRPIVIKPHPNDRTARTRSLLQGLPAADSRLCVTDANIHDILGAAAVLVTINSAVAVEAMLHGVPSVLCGHADFHHAAITLRDPGGMDRAIKDACAGAWPQAEFLYWYFRMNCVDAGSPRLVEDALSRIAATGYNVAAFGPDASAMGG